MFGLSSNQIFFRLALVIMSASFVLGCGCMRSKLPTTEKGATGMPTSKFDPGTPPASWQMDPELLPIYPGARRFDSWRSYITPDPMDPVVKYYEDNLTGAQVVKSTGAVLVVTFKTNLFNLEVKTGEGDNTLITFSQPDT